MKTLKFSEDYEKLPFGWEGSEVELLSVTPISIDGLKQDIPSFIEFDTKFRGKEGYYELNFNQGLVLVFIHIQTGKIFSTIRRNYKEKFEYYSTSIGERFTLVRSSSNDKGGRRG